MSAKIVTVDVRDTIRWGGDPFSRIMSAVTALRAGQVLRVIAPFEPVPLFGVLEQRGFSHKATLLPEGDWEVFFERAGAQPPREKAIPGGLPPSDPSTASVIEVDARGLEPPQPLVVILEAVSALPPGATLRAHTDRRPMHLYPQLESRGFVGETEEQKDGSFITHIRLA